MNIQEIDNNYVNKLLNNVKLFNDQTSWMYLILAKIEFREKYSSPNFGVTTYSSYLCELDAMAKYPFGWYGILPSNKGKVCNWKNKNMINKDIDPTYFYSY
jgi:hypothetical protein